LDSPHSKPRPPRGSSTLRNVLSNWAGSLVASLVAFFLSPFVVHHLGNSAYGLWVLIGSLTGYLGLLDLGVRGAVTRYVAKFYAQSNHQEASRVVSTALLIFLLAGMLAIAVSLTVAIFLASLFRVPEAYESTARLVLVLLGFNVAVSLVSGVFGGVLVGLQRFDLVNAIEIVSALFRAVAVVVALSAGKGLLALAFIHLALAVATTLVYAWTDFRLYPELEFRLGKYDRQHLKLIFSFSAYAFLLQVSFLLISYTDSVVIGIFLPVSAVTFFVIAGNLITYSRGLISGISTTMTPLTSALETQGHKGELQRVVLKGTRYTTLIILPIALTFLLRGTSFIALWMGPEYAGLSGRVLWILTLALVFAAGNQTAIATMLGISKHKALVPVILSEALCNLALSIALVRRMGIIGVAWGTTLPSLAVSFLFWPWYMRRTLGIPVQRYALSTWGWPGIAALPFALCTYAIERLRPAPNLPFFFLEVGAALPVALLGAWYVGLSAADRQQFSKQFGRPAIRAFWRT
jgi:O-antigen/teichoic acid export membrane protein